MVAGDLVNTAARIQSAADPSTVLVGEATKRASEAAIAYAAAGEHNLKGRTEQVALWRALRVTAGRGGALKSAGLEPPFVGRDRELRLVKELFHATIDERRNDFRSPQNSCISFRMRKDADHAVMFQLVHNRPERQIQFVRQFEQNVSPMIAKREHIAAE